MNNTSSNITDTQLNSLLSPSDVSGDRAALLPLALVIAFPLVVVACLYACIFRMDKNRER